MRFNVRRFVLTALAIDALLFLAGCDTSWTTEASSILALLGPAISAALEILSAFGVGISANVMTQFNAWAQKAQTGLADVASLVAQYNSATAAAKPGILTEIQAAIGVVDSDLATLLPLINVTDPNSQAKVVAVFGAIKSELAALLALVPAVTEAASMPQDVATKHIVAAVKATKLLSAKQFADDFNKKAGALGPQFKIKGRSKESDIVNGLRGAL